MDVRFGGTEFLSFLTLLSASLIMIFASSSCGADSQYCGRLCDADFWYDAPRGGPTASDVKSELDRGSKASGTGYAYGTTRTPLHFAVEARAEDAIIELLVDRGAKVNAKDWAGDTALHVATLYGYSPQVAALLEQGANKRARNASGDTPCEYAVEVWNRGSFMPTEAGRLVC